MLVCGVWRLIKDKLDRIHLEHLESAQRGMADMSFPCSCECLILKIFDISMWSDVDQPRLLFQIQRLYSISKINSPKSSDTCLPMICICLRCFDQAWNLTCSPYVWEEIAIFFDIASCFDNMTIPLRCWYQSNFGGHIASLFMAASCSNTHIWSVCRAVRFRMLSSDR